MFAPREYVEYFFAPQTLFTDLRVARNLDHRLFLEGLQLRRGQIQGRSFHKTILRFRAKGREGFMGFITGSVILFIYEIFHRSVSDAR